MNNAQAYAIRYKALQDAVVLTSAVTGGEKTVKIATGFANLGVRDASVAELIMKEARTTATWLLEETDWDEEEPTPYFTVDEEADPEAGRFQDPEVKFGMGVEERADRGCTCGNVPPNAYSPGCPVHDPDTFDPEPCVICGSPDPKKHDTKMHKAVDAKDDPNKEAGSDE